jgi:hypothetical protein
MFITLFDYDGNSEVSFEEFEAAGKLEENTNTDV